MDKYNKTIHNRRTRTRTNKNAIYPFNDLIYEHLVDVDALSKLKNLRTNEHHKST